MASNVQAIFTPSVLESGVRKAQAMGEGSYSRVFRTLELRFLRRIFRSHAFGLGCAVEAANTRKVRGLFVVVVSFLRIRDRSYVLLSRLCYVLSRDRNAGSRRIRFRGSRLFRYYRNGLYSGKAVQHSKGQCVFEGVFLASGRANDVRKDVS